jgi:hypothetical protein
MRRILFGWEHRSRAIEQRSARSSSMTTRSSSQADARHGLLLESSDAHTNSRCPAALPRGRDLLSFVKVATPAAGNAECDVSWGRGRHTRPRDSLPHP